jgi:hypothetical protein
VVRAHYHDFLLRISPLTFWRAVQHHFPTSLRLTRSHTNVPADSSPSAPPPTPKSRWGVGGVQITTELAAVCLSRYLALRGPKLWWKKQ